MTKPAIPQAVLEQHVAVLGKTGAGKTSTEKLAIEQVVKENFRVCILDTTKSDWWGITSSADGRKPGLPFKILGGPHGHVPLHSSAGKAIGQLVGAGKLPLSIIDMADFEAGGIQRFFVDFAPALMRSMRGVVYLVIEEAHELAPKERAGFGAENMAIHWAKKLATAGRSKGIRLVVATQRVQALHNAVLGSCETVIAHRLTTPADQKPVLDWLKANADKVAVAEVAGTIASLPTGTGWVCSGEARIFERIAFPKFWTFDNTATPTRDGAEVSVKTAPVDADELRAIIGDAVKDAEANDPRALRAEIAKLKAELGKKDAPSGMAMLRAGDPTIKEAIEQAEVKGRMAGRDDVLNAIYPVHSMLNGLRDDLSSAIEPLSKAIDHLSVALPPLGPLDKVPLAQPKRQPLASTPPAPRSSTGTEKLPAGERAVLIACAQHNGCSREQLTVLTGYKRSSRDSYIQRLREKGFAEVQGDRVLATEDGIAALGDYTPLPVGSALRAYWEAKLPEGERAVLKVLTDEYPAAIARVSIDGKTGYKRSSRDSYIQRLKSRQLLTIVGGDVRASDQLFD